MVIFYRKLVIVSDEQEFRGAFEKNFPHLFKNVSCRDACLNVPTVTVASMPNISALNRLCSSHTETFSLITGRMPLGEMVPIHQPARMVILPWCSTTVFLNWIALLLSEPQATIFSEWFFARSNEPGISKTVDKLTAVLQNLHTWNFYEMKTANVAMKAGCSQRYMEKQCINLFGVTPGLLLRAYQMFAITAKLMQKEEMIKACRRGSSPLAEIPTDYRRSLKRLLGITYTELRQAAIYEHWAAVWMRKWRENLHTNYDVPENICNKNKGGKYNKGIFNHLTVA